MRRIGDSAFRFCSNMTSAVIGTGVSSMEDMAFFGCSSLNTITFLGDAPSIADNCFTGVTATVYYPADNSTWTEDVLQNYGGSLTWVAG